MSIYGYDKETNPYLDSLLRGGGLYLFDNVKSSGIGTVPAFRYMMTSLSRDTSEMDWDKEIFLLDIIKSAGYESRWISNQASAGIHDNIVARFADLADSVIWCGTKYVGPSKTDLDEDVLEPVHLRAKESGADHFTVVHLCGNHENFKSRYPESFNVFAPEDYLDKPKIQRQTLAEYDNSVLYNDWIVYSIINQFEDRDAVVIYLPDHSLDIFDSSEDYAGHARSNDPNSVMAGKNIPFLVYVSKTCRIQRPDLEYRLRKSLHNDFETENLMYAIMDIMGIDFTGERQGLVHDYSLFSEAL